MTPSSSSERGILLVLAYLWPLALVPLLVARDDAELQWHARHGLVLTVVEGLVLFVLVFVSSAATLASFVVGCVLSVFIVLTLAAIIALHAVAIIKALNGSRLLVPVVSSYAGRF